MLGMLLLQGVTPGIKSDPRAGAHLLQLAADTGHLFSLCELGSCYVQGTGVARNPEKGVEMLQHGAQQGEAGCLYGLATSHLLAESGDDSVLKAALARGVPTIYEP